MKNKKMEINIGTKKYIIEKINSIPVQDVSDNKSIYGWTLEIRYKDNSGKYYDWSVYSNKKIYSSRVSAIEAGIKVSKIDYYKSRDVEYRVGALYMMDSMEWRDYKIQELLDSDSKEEDITIQFWKVKEDFQCEYIKNKVQFKKGTLFIKYGKEILISATPNLTTIRGRNNTFKWIKDNGCILEEVDIIDEKCAHPHLIKEIKNKLNLK